MYGEYLKLNVFYMNPVTGSVETGRNWEGDYKEAPGLETWEEWGGGTLIEVEFLGGEWREVE